MSWTIDAVSFVLADNAVEEETCFVAVLGGGATGWYGPIIPAVGAHVRDTLAKAAIGRSVEDHQGLVTALRRAGGEAVSRGFSWAVGAVDCAAWDLHGQLAQAPVAQLLSPVYQSEVPLYASWLRLDITDPPSIPIVQQVGHQGWQFTKWGLRRHPETDTDLEAERLVGAARKVAAVLTSQPAFDAVFTWDELLAERVAGRLALDSVRWLEDPLPTIDLAAYTSLTNGMPIALGESLILEDDAMQLLSLSLEAVTLDVVGCGGLTRAVELVHAAVASGVPVYPHGRSFIPAVHLAAAYPDAIPAVEYRLQWEPDRESGYAQPWLPNSGVVMMPSSPGLGATPRNL